MELIINTQEVILSSRCQVLKTQRFIKDSYRFDGIDNILNIMVGSILKNKEAITSGTDTYKVSFGSDSHVFYFCVRQSFDRQIIFYRYEDFADIKRINDRSLISLFFKDKQFSIKVEPIKDIVEQKEFNKLYRLSSSSTVNFPLLSAEQKSLISIEDQNVIIQGVAGSGKTNICIEKIVYSACRGYSGKVLYTTFSRGLLIDTKEKVQVFIDNLQSFINNFQQEKIVFIDKDRKKAIENFLGIYLNVTEQNIVSKVADIINYLKNNVDYYLLEDIYKNYKNTDINIADENFFIKKYINSIKNHQLSVRLSKIKNLSYEVIYKEIYGLILGSNQQNTDMLTQEQYLALRIDSFSRYEAETIYLLSKDYNNFLHQNNMVDNNSMARELLKDINKQAKYSVAILDEVQDLTEINLLLYKELAIKLFCVGDALQMINPSYFSFAYLKRLLYVQDVVSVATLKHNYRNTQKIASIIDRFGQINTKQFGTHNFVLKTESVDSSAVTNAVYIKGKEFIDGLKNVGYENCTIIVADNKTKENFRSKLQSQEILTVAEIKGLERETVILTNILSANYDKFASLDRISINRKQADENSVYRYYFNLFYVGLSRAKTNIYVAEEKEVPLFKEFLTQSFAQMQHKDALKSINSVANKIEIDQHEIVERVVQFIKLSQYENARFTTNKILDDKERNDYLRRIEIEEEYVSRGKYRDAGIRFWEYGMLNDARRQFKLSQDESLITLMDASVGQGDANIGIDMVSYLPSVLGQSTAEKLIIDTIKKDLQNIKDTQKQLDNKFKKIKEIK